MKTKSLLLSALVALAVLAAVYFAVRFADTRMMAVMVGIVFGVLVSIPTSLLVSLTEKKRKPNDPESQHRAEVAYWDKVEQIPPHRVEIMPPDIPHEVTRFLDN